jgi:Skp family chaperone for outer membrane proteins
VTAGLEVKVIITAVRDPKQTDMNKRIKLTFPSQPSMISKLDDGTMPEPSKLQPAPIDAGPTKAQLAVATKAAEADVAAEPKRQAGEEKERQAEEAKLAKAAAAEEKKRKDEEAAKAAAEEKKKKEEEFRNSAEEKKRVAEEERKKKEDERKAAAEELV